MTDWSYSKDVEMCALLVKGGRYRTLENWCETQKSVSTRKLSGRVGSLHEFDKAIARRILSLTQANKALEAENAELRKAAGIWQEFAKRTLEDLPAEIRKDPGTPVYAWGKITEAGCFEIYVGDFEKMANKEASDV